MYPGPGQGGGVYVACTCVFSDENGGLVNFVYLVHIMVDIPAGFIVVVSEMLYS